MSNVRCAVVLATAVLAAGSMPSFASPIPVAPRSDSAISFQFQLFGNANLPYMQLQNRSSAASITSMGLTIGRLDHNFDFVRGPVAVRDTRTRLVPTLLSDARFGSYNDRQRPDQIAMSFVGFNPGDIFRFQADIDRDSTNTYSDYRRTLFNNGGHPNSILTVNFRHGSQLGSLALTLPDRRNETSPYTYAASGQLATDAIVADVPEPGTLALLGAGLAGVVAIGCKRRKRTATMPS